MPHSECTGIIILGNPDVMLLKIRCNNRLGNSVTSAECQHRDGTISIERRVAYPRPSCRTLLWQYLAFHSKQPNFRLERNLLRRDEVMRKQSSCGVVLPCLPDLGRSMTFPVCWNLFSSQLTADSWRWKCRAMSLANMPAVSILIALSHCSNVIQGFFFFSFCAYDKKALKLCTVWPRGIIRFAVHILHSIFMKVKIYDYIMT